MAACDFLTIPSWFGPIRIDPDPERSRFLPTRKVRGKKRYYRTLRRKAESFRADLSGWYDYHHWHVDWRGVGNLGWSERRAHLSALFTTFRRLLAETAGWSTPHQAWVCVNAYDSGHDAVFLHTANPNEANFPNLFPGTRWDAEIPACLREFIDPGWEFGRFDDGGTAFIVRPRSKP